MWIATYWSCSRPQTTVGLHSPRADVTRYNVLLFAVSTIISASPFRARCSRSRCIPTYTYTYTYARCKGHLVNYDTKR